MKIAHLIEKVQAHYQLAPDYPFEKHPDIFVFRHTKNKKWLCLYAEIKTQALFSEEEKKIPLINVKVRPDEMTQLLATDGILPAYHMNKKHWVSVLLDKASDELIWELVNHSYELTKK
ncbi:MmcQ/YjbR family DNA-binding protein [Pelistega sp. MC2]|uniref:MmcQ/YjbR family DNA-binding protein n=1 Tax=Pelistega sp. MC2 TaxID=1720297 RepID=UPI0008DB21B7|nr:MmcQ/YjbR family DNA-binding protein [Pelistega sp. MC2]